MAQKRKVEDVEFDDDEFDRLRADPNRDQPPPGACLLWVDKHRPKTLDECDHHPELTTFLKGVASSNSIPHILFYGLPGCGRMTRVRCLLRELFGEDVEKVRIENREIEVPKSSANVDIELVRSSFHMQMSPSDVGSFKDRIITQVLIKEMAETAPVSGKAKFKVVVLTEADLLSEGAQAALRRTMEKYSKNLRMIFVAENASKMMGAIRSRTLQIRIPTETDEKVKDTLCKVAAAEGITVPPDLALRIAKHWHGNTRAALLALECLRGDVFLSGQPLTSQMEVPSLGWEKLCRGVVDLIMSQQTPKSVMNCRALLYDALTAGAPGLAILERLLEELLERPQVRNSEQRVLSMMEAAGQSDHSLALGTKEIFHLEAFVTQAMKILVTQP